MKINSLIFFILLTGKKLLAGEPVYPNGFEPKKPVQSITFTENKGQVSDQNNKPRPDVLFGGNANEMVFHLRNNGISYQLSRVDTWKMEDTLLSPHHKTMPGENKKVPDQISVYRVDINWLNCNKNFTLQQDESLPGYTNYYHEVCPNGVHEVKTYKGVSYKNIYNNIDLHYYEKDGNLKYDYIVAPYTDYKQIQLQVKGAEKITLQKNGSVAIKTTFGEIIEGTPVVFQHGKQLAARWVIKNNVLGFEVDDPDPSLKLEIDPAIRIWGTYYGGAGQEHGYTCATDPNGNIYMGGEADVNSGSTIATLGAHQTSYSGGISDGFLAKFDNNGSRLWATYYGGTDRDYFVDCATDSQGNSFACGVTWSTGSVIATPGSHQPVLGWVVDAFLVKFNSAGIRQWATYYGGIFGGEHATACATDASGNIFMCGYNSEGGINNGTAIASPGAHQTTNMGTFEAFLVKFNSNGVRQWGTYYGTTEQDHANDVCTDAIGNVFICGTSQAPTSTNIATPGSHQPTTAALLVGFLAKFNSAGVRQWGTYYGGTLGSPGDEAHTCATDPQGNVFIAGRTYNSTGTMIATPGSHQSTYAGGNGDGYLVKFNTNGVRQWGTYYGGPAYDVMNECTTDQFGNIYVIGATGTHSGDTIATFCSHQYFYGGGGHDSYMVKFNNSGVRQWGSYFGGTEQETTFFDCTTDANGNLFVSGRTTSTVSALIATSSGHQINHAGGLDAILMKFGECMYVPLVNTTPASNHLFCEINTTTLSVSSNSPVTWFSGLTSTSSIGSGTTFVTPGLSAGSYSYYAEPAHTCSANICRLNITVTVNLSPTISVNNGSICSGESFTIVASGASTYTFSGGSNVVSPGSTTNYTVTGTSTAGCSNTVGAISSITVNLSPTITVSNGSICLGQTFTINPAGANTYTISGGNFVLSPTVNTNYSVTGTSSAGCISNAVVASVTVNPLPNITAVSNPSSTCLGESAVLSASGANNYTWNPSGNTNTILVTPNTTTTYSVIGTDNNGCSNNASVSILVKPNPTVSVNNATICSGTQAVLNASVNPSSGITYNWLPGGENAASINVNPNSTTVYSVTVNLDGCIGMTTSTVNVVTAITPNAAFSYNGPYCTNQNAVSPILPLTFANGGQFNSTPAGLSMNPSTGLIDPTNSVPGIYQITYTLAASGCSTSATGTANVQITVPAQLNLAPQVSMLTGESYTLNVSGASSYSWSPPDFLSCTNCQNPIASPPYSMTYCVSSPNDVCIAKTCITINVETSCQGMELSLPNAFSPNGDGSNDEYCLRGWNECISEFKIIIYNRWGEKVYESEQTEFCWDGSYKGKTQETEVFVYMLKAKLKDGTQISKNGNITLLR